jgi:hypothetical protein
MNCAEFHKLLPAMFESGGAIEDQEHLASCPNCTDLVNDLRYIADQAKLLLPMHDPSPRVWNNIQASLQKEGIGRADRKPRLERKSPKKKEWPTLGWAAGLAASLLIGFALLNYSRHQSEPQSQSQSEELASANTQNSLVPQAPDTAVSEKSSDDDTQLLSEVEHRSPSLKSVYEHNLHNVNNYISEAKDSVRLDPNDAEARQHLREAYAQKAMLYEMATTRSLE